MKFSGLSYDNAKTGLKITIPIVIALFSIFVLSRIVSSDWYTKGLIDVIDANRDSVLKLTASSTSVSVAISALPGDLATPIAEKMADLSIGFMIVLSAIYIEKFIILVTGLVVFKWLVPVACLLHIAGDVFKGKQRLKEVSYKLAVLALALVLIMPASVSITKVIRNMYGETLDETVRSAETSADLIKQSFSSDDGDEDSAKGLAGVIQSLKESGDSIAAGTTEFMRYLEKLFTRYVDSVAILAVTSCIIPILVILVIWNMVKIIFLPNMTVSIPSFKKQL